MSDKKLERKVSENTRERSSWWEFVSRERQNLIFQPWPRQEHYCMQLGTLAAFIASESVWASKESLTTSSRSRKRRLDMRLESMTVIWTRQILCRCCRSTVTVWLSRWRLWSIWKRRGRSRLCCQKTSTSEHKFALFATSSCPGFNQCRTLGR